MRADELEELVWEEIKKVLLNPELILAHIDSTQQAASESAPQGEHTAVSERLASLDMEERHLYRLYASGRYARGN